MLRYQLQDTTFRNIVLTQFWIVSHHLQLLMPSIKRQLLALLERTRGYWDHPLIANTQLLSHDSVWRQWKLDKCQPDLDVQREWEASPPRKKRQQPPAVAQAAPETFDLKAVSKQMRKAAPPFNTFLNEYAEALDPDAGIEAEYHPRNNKLYCWRAIRTVPAEKLCDIQLPLARIC